MSHIAVTFTQQTYNINIYVGHSPLYFKSFFGVYKTLNIAFHVFIFGSCLNFEEGTTDISFILLSIIRESYVKKR